MVLYNYFKTFNIYFVDPGFKLYIINNIILMPLLRPHVYIKRYIINLKFAYNLKKVRLYTELIINVRKSIFKKSINFVR